MCLALFCTTILSPVGLLIWERNRPIFMQLNCNKCHDGGLEHLRHSYIACEYDIRPLVDQQSSGAAAGDHMVFPETSQMAPGTRHESN